MNAVVDIDARRLRRLSAALEDLERWAENESSTSATDPSWKALRDRGTAEATFELGAQEGAESAYADVAARLALVRATLAAAPETSTKAERFRAALEALRGELAWCEAQRREALNARGASVEPEEIHAAGRAEALSAIAEELRSTMDAAPLGRL